MLVNLFKNLRKIWKGYFYRIWLNKKLISKCYLKSHTLLQKNQLLDSFTKPKMKKENEHLHEYNSSCCYEIENVKSSKINDVSFRHILDEHNRTLKWMLEKRNTQYLFVQRFKVDRKLFMLKCSIKWSTELLHLERGRCWSFNDLFLGYA